MECVEIEGGTMGGGGGGEGGWIMICGVCGD